MTIRIQIFKDSKGEHRWRIVAKNGQTTGTSGEGFRDATDAQRAARAFVESILDLHPTSYFPPALPFERVDGDPRKPAAPEPPPAPAPAEAAKAAAKPAKAPAAPAPADDGEDA